MEGISQVSDTSLLPVGIPVYSYYLDHHLEGKAVFPAVEALQILADAAAGVRPDLAVVNMAHGRFEKFLPIPADSSRIDAAVEIQTLSDGAVRALLLTKIRSGKSAMTRSLVHAAVEFDPKLESVPAPPIDLHGLLEGICLDVSPEDIYRELVPFGPAFRNIAAPLHVSEDGAIARIDTPVVPDPRAAGRSLGSPFSLDAAFHAACVWSQRYQDTVAFPVGFEHRRVHRPTLPGKTYYGRVMPVRTEKSLLIFDIWIYDSEGVLYEGISGLGMQDVSKGRVMPPRWIKQTAGGRFLQNIRRNCRDLCVSEIKALPPFAARALSPAELKRFVTLGKKRRESFLAARLACKRILRRVSGNNLETPAAAIETLTPDLKRPCCRRIDTGCLIACSVAHDERFAIVVASDGASGVDVEKISTRVLRSLDLFLNREEHRLMRSVDLESAETAIRIWSIKEAVAKGLNLNLAEAWRRVTVKQAGRHESLFGIDSQGSFAAFHDVVEAHLFTYTRLA